MHEADGRCHLFTPAIAAALQASSLQARGAAERAGDTLASLSATGDRARLRAWSVPCTSPDLATAANRVRDAFAGYAGLNEMSFPGAVLDLAGGAQASSLDGGRQAGGGAALAPVANRQVTGWPRHLWHGGRRGRPRGRDDRAGSHGRDLCAARGARSGQGAGTYIDPRLGGLAGRAAPASVTRTFFAQTRTAAPVTLSPNGQGGATQFAFPPAAAAALEGLDAREAVRIEFVYSGRTGDRVSSVLVEVGDFAAGRAFLAVR